MRASLSDFEWSFGNVWQAADNEEHVPMLPSDSDNESENSAPRSHVGHLSESASDFEAEGATSTRLKASEIMSNWGIDSVDLNEVPILMLPEPIVFLILKGTWSEIVLSAHWHENLCDSQGRLSWRGKSLFQNLDWPTSDAHLWMHIGQKHQLLPKTPDISVEDH